MMTGYVISALPIGLGLLLFVLNRPYMMTFFTPASNLPCGLGMIIAALLMIGIGFAIVMKIVKIEV
jgi:tight adherence protein B